MWSDWSKWPSALWDEIDVKSVTGVCKLLFLIVGHQILLPTTHILWMLHSSEILFGG